MYLELDAVVSLINPFPDINAENPTLAGFRGKAVKVTGYTYHKHSAFDTSKKLTYSLGGPSRRCSRNYGNAQGVS